MILENPLRWRSVLAPLVATIIAGCSPAEPEQLLVKNTFDVAPPAGVPAALLSAEQVHTGAQAGKVGLETEFAPLSNATWEALGQAHHLRLRLWTWLPDNREQPLMLTVATQRNNGSKDPITYQTVNLREVVRRYRQWVPSTFFISLPRMLLPTDVVNMYLWAPPGPRSPVYIDDFSIEKLD